MRDGIEGFVIPVRDSDAVAQAVLRLAGDTELRREMAVHAGARALEYDFGAYSRSLLAALGASWHERGR